MTIPYEQTIFSSRLHTGFTHKVPRRGIKKNARHEIMICSIPRKRGDPTISSNSKTGNPVLSLQPVQPVTLR